MRSIGEKYRKCNKTTNTQAQNYNIQYKQCPLTAKCRKSIYLKKTAAILLKQHVDFGEVLPM